MRVRAVFACGKSSQRSVELYSSYSIILVYSHAPEESNSPAAEVPNPASLDKVVSLQIISLWDIFNNIQAGVEFLPLGN